MPGLMNAGRKPMRGSDDGGEANVTPEEQQQYDQFVANGMQLLYNKKAMPQLLQMIAGDGDPVEGLANALVMVVTRLEDSAGEQGTQLSPDVMMHGGTELLEQMADLAEKGGVHEFDEKEMESALYMAMDMYRSTRQQQGKLPEDQLKADMQQLVQADQAGELDQIIPGIDQYAKKMPGQGV